MHEMTDPADNSSFRFRFSVWDLILLTGFVAILFALPLATLGVVVAVAINVALVLAFLVYYSFPSTKVKKGTVNSYLRECIGQWFIYSSVTSLIGGIAIILKSTN